MESVDVILLSPPFYRFCGSHNDRCPLSLCYLSSHLKAAGISHKVVNADYTGATTYRSIRSLFDDYESFVDAVDGKGGQYGEVLELIMSYSPKSVVIMGADPLVPTKDLGSPYIAANFSRKLRALGIHTVGLSPYYNLEPEKFEADFDALFLGLPARNIVDVIKNKSNGRVKADAFDPETIPNFDQLVPSEQGTNVMVTSVGCVFPCSFCIAGEQTRRYQKKVDFLPIATIVADLNRRSEERVYLIDLNFSNYSVKQLEELVVAIEAAGIKKEYVIEIRLDGITEERMQLMQRLGVVSMKIGIEGVSDKMMDEFKKKHIVAKMKEKVDLIRQYKMDFIAYLLVGGETSPQDYDETIKVIDELKPDNVIVSIWAYMPGTDYKYDTHHSPLRLEEWGLDKEIFYRLLDYQKKYNSTVGTIFDA